MALASLSCSAEEPAPTATPAPQASAQEVVESACTNMDKVDDYDFVTTIKVTENGGSRETDMTLKGSVSGKDFHTTLDAPGSPNEERLRAAGVDYRTTTGNTPTWKVSDRPLRDVDSMLGALGDSLICPDVTGVIEKGEEVLNGLKVTRYAAGDVDGSAKDGLYETDGDFRGDKKVEFHEYWVDSAGQLLQDRISWYLLAQEADFRNIISGVGTTTYLEVGEPNVITAPTIP